MTNTTTTDTITNTEEAAVAEKKNEKQTIKLGTAVTYLSSKGQQKMAFVTGTRKTIDKGTSVVRPQKGNVNLLVFAPNGTTYARFDVAPASEDATTNVFVL